jgi:hypothetical protein
LTNPASSITLSGQYKQPILLDSDYFGWLFLFVVIY